MALTEVYTQVTSDIKRINLLRGGARSSKTHSLIQMSIRWLWTGYLGEHHIPTGIALITRETFPALRRTVLREFINMMHSEGLMSYINWRRSVHEFEFQGRQITFLSLDDESKVLGMQTAWFWINEGNPVSYNIFQQLLMRCENFAFCDYNPFDEDGWLNQELELKRLPRRGDVSLTVSTFRMNPYLPPSMIQEIEYLKETDKALYDIYNLGNWAKFQGLVYPNWHEFDTDKPEGKVCYGLDFGYNHATALVKVTKAEDRKLYWEEIIYGRELTPSDVIALLNEMGFSKTAKIYADDSRPDSIEEVRRAGYNIRKARKGKVFTSITAIKKYHLFVKGANLISEVKRYRWKEDKHDSLDDEPLKKDDDAMDAGRYGSSKLIRQSTFKLGNY